MGSCRPDDHKVQISTVATDAFNGGHSCTLDSCTSILALIILTDETEPSVDCMILVSFML